MDDNLLWSIFKDNFDQFMRKNIFKGGAYSYISAEQGHLYIKINHLGQCEFSYIESITDEVANNPDHFFYEFAKRAQDKSLEHNKTCVHCSFLVYRDNYLRNNPRKFNERINDETKRNLFGCKHSIYRCECLSPRTKQKFLKDWPTFYDQVYGVIDGKK